MSADAGFCLGVRVALWRREATARLCLAHYTQLRERDGYCGDTRYP